MKIAHRNLSKRKYYSNINDSLRLSYPSSAREEIPVNRCKTSKHHIVKPVYMNIFEE